LFNLPMHPAAVHLPLALAMLVPPLAVGTLWAIRAGKAPRAAWLLVVALQALLVGGALVALRTGDSEAERIEDRIAEGRLEAHQSAAQQFTVVAGLTLALAAAALVAGRVRPRAGAVAAMGTVVMSLVVAGLAVRTGHRGGELVYGPGGLGDPDLAATSRGSEEESSTVEEDEHGDEREGEEADGDDDDDRDRSLARIGPGRDDHDRDCDHDDGDDRIDDDDDD
jgi:uncharacterized membrane protein